MGDQGVDRFKVVSPEGRCFGPPRHQPARQVSIPPSADPRRRQIQTRDKEGDGRFWYSVVTTGIYCRPSCPSRTANPENVTIHATLAEAQATGFRPCRRCKPASPAEWSRHLALVALACELIEKADVPMTLKGVAAAVGLSANYFHRVFRDTTGVTLKTYSSARRGHRLRDALASGETVTAALYYAGFNSSGRFYESSWALLGMTPTKFRDGAPEEDIRVAGAATQLGPMLVASTASGVMSISSGDLPTVLRARLHTQFPNARFLESDEDYMRTVSQVIGAVDACCPGEGLPHNIRMVAFQHRVWQAFKALERLRTVTDAKLAAEIAVDEGSVPPTPAVTKGARIILAAPPG